MREKVFEYNGKKYKVIRPTAKIREESEEVELKAFADGMRKGFLCRDEMEKLLRERGIWGEEEEKQLEEVRSKIRELLKELRLESGKKKSQKIYEKIKTLRQKEQELFSKYDSYFSMTCDSRATNQRLMYLIASCVLDAEGNRVWKDFDSFKAEEDTGLLSEAINQAMSFFLDLDIDLSTYPEDRIMREKENSTNKETASS